MTKIQPGRGMLRPNARFVGLIAAALAVLLGGAYRLYETKVTPATSKSVFKLTIAASGPIGSCPLVMAQANGYLAAEGVTAAFIFGENGGAALTRVLNGNADLAITGETAIVYAALDGRPVSVVATLTTATDNAILARRDRGVITPTDLKGKRIGVSRVNTTEFFLDAFLNRHHLSSADVLAVDMTPTQLIEAIIHGELDAIAMYEPYVSMAATALGRNGVVMSDKTIYDIFVSLVATRDYANSHQKILEGVLRAAIRGAQFCKDAPDASDRIAGIMNIDPALLKNIWAAHQFEVTLRQGLLLTLEDEARWAIRKKLTQATNIPNFLEHLDLAPLQAVSPSAVTVIR